jgi:steroid 5-alpha reductase family enzyme
MPNERGQLVSPFFSRKIPTIISDDHVKTGADPPALFVCLALVDLALAFATSHLIGGAPYRNTALIGFVTHTIGWLHGSFFQTEKFFDFAYATTFVLTLSYTYAHTSNPHPRKLLSSALVLVWALRLGYFLFSRFLERKRDFRHDEIKTLWAFNLFAWWTQALWIWWVGCAAFSLNLSPNDDEQPELNVVDAIGVYLYCLGSAIEIVADRQKTSFLSRHPRKETFIDEGLWFYSRHPNYCGEILIWVGVCVVAWKGAGVFDHDDVAPSTVLFRAWSPLFAGLFLFGTSVQLLKDVNDKAFGDRADYQAYVKRARVFLPIP